jgi:hypothetical protein
MDDPTDSGLAIAGLMILGACAICCVGIVIKDVMSYKKLTPKNESLLNNGDNVLSEVTVE